MGLFKSAGFAVHRRMARRRYRGIYEEFREYTMIPREVFVDNLTLAAGIGKIRGSVVECGVWRGGMSAGLARVLGNDRTYHLFDSFQGLPPAKEIDGCAAIAWQNDTTSQIYYDNCAAPIEQAMEAMRKSGASTVKIVKGWFADTLPNFVPEDPIALLRLDADWYDSTMLCLECLFKYVATGGIVIVDDYYAWDGCARAVHDFLCRCRAVERIRSRGAVCYILKQTG